MTSKARDRAWYNDHPKPAPKVYELHCPDCGTDELIKLMDWHTLVGCYSPPGHDHDDNCIRQEWECKNGHEFDTHPRIPDCPAPGCTWKPKTTCFCHKGEKTPL